MPESPSGVSSSHRGTPPRSETDALDPERNAPPPREFDLPATFGKYFLTEKLATGGMAEIYLAKIVGPGGFEKQLVIKQIHPKLSGQRHFVDLFVAEAKTLVTLAHGNIVPVYELGVIDDTYFIAMEYIDGPTLYRLTETLRRKAVAMEPPIAAWITARILEGLDYAHRKGDGVIHRDLSPRNVMLSRDGEVKLVDFGIAVTLGSASDDDRGGSAPTGSFPYMSPEQVRKQPLTVQTDLFSVGVLFWEMLVGHRLFARSDPEATLSAVVAGDIARPSADRPAVPVKLDGVVMRALERDLSARWTSASDMLAALQRYLYGLDEPPGPRDLAALVARYCPPETRRLPTHHDLLGEPDWSPDATQPRRAVTAPTGDSDAPRPGPATAVIPRDGAGPRGKRPTRARTETFATHVALDEILERASPPVTGGNDAAASAEVDPRELGAASARDVTSLRRPRPSTAPPSTSTSARGAPAAAGKDAGTFTESGPREPRDPSTRDDATPRTPRPRSEPPSINASTSGAPAPVQLPGRVPPSGSLLAASTSGAPAPVQLPGRVPPSGSLLVLAGIGALGLGAASVYVFFKGRDAVEHRDATLRRDAARPPDAMPMPDATTTAVAIPPVDAGEPAPDAATTEAAIPPVDAADPAHDAAVSIPAVDARPVQPRDPGRRPLRPDPRGAVELPRIDAGAARPTGTATLTIGANPWGNVLLDGKKIGRTPIEHLSVPAGRHAIDVTFGGEDPPRTLRYTVDLSDGETRDVLADFTRP